MFNFKLNKKQRKPEKVYKVIALGKNSKLRSVVAGNTFKVTFRERLKKKMKGVSIVINQKKFYFKLDGCVLKSKNSRASLLKKKKNRKKNKIGFFFNFRNNLKFFKKYKLTL